MKKLIQDSTVIDKHWQQGFQEGHACAIVDFYTHILLRLSPQGRMDVIQAVKNAVDELHEQNIKNNRVLTKIRKKKHFLSEDDYRNLVEQIEIGTNQVQLIETMLNIFTDEEFARL